MLPNLPGVEGIVHRAKQVLGKIVEMGLIKESAVISILGFYLGTISFSVKNGSQ